MTPILSLCICVWNKSLFTKQALKDLIQLPDSHQIIIVDNGSADDTEEVVKSFPRVKYLRLNENKGFAVASNIAYGLAEAPNVCFLNNDVKVKSNHANWTEPLLKHCDAGLVGPTMGQLDASLNFVQEANKMLPGNSYLSGWCLAGSKKIFEQLEIPRKPGDINTAPQIFSEEFGLAYFEDSDAGFRSRKQGIKMQVVDIPVVHFGKQTSSQLNVHKLYTEARKIFVSKWGKV